MIALVAVVVLGLGVASFFIFPMAHTLSTTVALSAGGVEASALVLKVSLWTIPWIAGALGVLAVLVFAYEIIRNTRVKTLAAKIEAGAIADYKAIAAEVKKL